MIEAEAIEDQEKLGRQLISTTEKFGSVSSSCPFESPAKVTGNDELTTTPTTPSSMNSKEHDRTMSMPSGRRRPRRIYLNKFRVPIYVQLCLVICILCGLCVMVVAIATVSRLFLDPY